MLTSVKKYIPPALTTPAFTTGAGVFALFIIFFWNSVADWVTLWNTDPTYSHGLLIPFLTLYLIWQNKELLINSSLKPAYSLLIPLGLTLTLWLLASITDTQTIELTLLPFIFIFAYTSIIGYRASLVIIAPLLFLVLATPIWSVLTPLLQKLAVISNEAALKLSGIPTHIVGTQISIPAGNFEIEGGCSGLKYLVATLALGAFYGLSTFNKLKPVFLILVLSIVFSIILNWVRIYIIILVGEYSNMQSPLIKDHDNFGWLLYGVSLVPFYLIIKRIMKNTASDEKGISNVSVNETINTQRYFPILPAALILVTASFSIYLENKTPLMLEKIPTPLAVYPWAGPILENKWKPEYKGATIEENLLYLGTDKKPDITLSIFYYGKQSQDVELINQLNSISAPQTLKSQDILKNNQFSFIENIITTSENKLRIVFYWFHINGKNTIKPAYAKLLQANELLSGKSTSSLISVSSICNTHCDEERTELDRFIKKHQTHIFKSLTI